MQIGVYTFVENTPDPATGRTCRRRNGSAI